MNIISKVTIRNLKLNRKRTIGTIIGITLSVALICCVALMFSSLRKTFIETEKIDSGNFHVHIKNVNSNDLNTLKNNRKVKKINEIYNLELSYKADNNYINQIYSVNNNDFYSDMNLDIIKGRYPKGEDEIIISDDEVNYKYGDLVTLDTIKLDITNIDDDISSLPKMKKQYKIVGVYLNNYSVNSYFDNPMFTTGSRSNDIDIYLRIKNPFNYKSEISNILNVDNFDDINNSKYTFELNDSLLRWEGFKFSDTTTRAFIAVFLIVVFIIMFTSIFCIRNAFAISTTEKVRTLSMLSSIGSTKKQIKKCVIKEGFYLGLISIPLGIILGFLATYILVFTINFLLSDYIVGNLKFLMDVPVFVIFLSIILGFITIYLSSIASAYRASKVSPIEGLRGNNDYKIKNKKLKTPRYVKKIFGVGGLIAYKNLKRSRKKYRTTVISLVVSILTFISMNSFIKYGFNITNENYKDVQFNLEVSLINSDISLDKLISENNIDNYTLHYSYINGINLNCDKYFSKFMKDNFSYVCDENSNYNAKIYAINDEAFKKYAKKLNLNYDKIKNDAILFNKTSIYKNGKTKYGTVLNISKNEIVKDDNISLKVAKTTDINIPGFELVYQDEYFIIDYKYHNDLDLISNDLYINSDNADDLETKLRDKYDRNIEIHNLSKAVRSIKSLLLLISIFLYGFITVITLIGVTNIFNTITSNVELRQREFAILKSIGMTKNEFNKMINLETVFYCLKSLFYGIILGNIGSYLVYKAVSERSDYGYSVPYVPILLSIVFVFILVFTIMRFSVKKINKQNIIETIRKENI